MESVSLSVCFDYDVELQRKARIHLATRHGRPRDSKDSLLPLFPPFSRDQNDFPHSSTAAVRRCVYLRAVGMGVFV